MHSDLPFFVETVCVRAWKETGRILTQGNSLSVENKCQGFNDFDRKGFYEIRFGISTLLNDASTANIPVLNQSSETANLQAMQQLNMKPLSSVQP